ncbi:hypothetical protein [Nocardioides speluncae]|uniref:hypothetical protein n=1 Tax=Nocardioides speluncae TaxID=2670337 RepID=UPI0012B16CF6|nr:hypothetical protein [Nocardioides speluncae]
MSVFESWRESRMRARRERAMLKRLRELDRLDRKHGLGAYPQRGYLPDDARRPAPYQDGEPVPGSRGGRGRRRGGGSLVAAILALTVTLGVVAWSPDAATSEVRSLIGLGPEPLGRPPFLEDTNGPYAFMKTQPGRDDQPVTWSPCRKIRVAINPDGAPNNYEDLVRTAADHITDQSGLQFDFVGETDERPDDDGTAGGSGDGGRDPEDWPPVLVAWATADEVPRLGGDVAGLGGATSIRIRPNFEQYVTGSVVLDRATYDNLGRGYFGSREAQAIIDHEFGHLVGLNHVSDRGELMAAENTGRSGWGPGDKKGLALLGSGKCR